MTDRSDRKSKWRKPVLTRLGSLRDIAGSRSKGKQSPVQLRS